MIEDHLPKTNSRYHPYSSRAEAQIAHLLDQYGLPFIYEKPTAVVDRGMTRLWYPDFSLCYGPIIEYFGVNGNAEYVKRTQHKLAVYRENQIEILPVYPHDMSRGWEYRLLGRIDHALEGRLLHYRNAIGTGYTPRRQAYGR